VPEVEAATNWLWWIHWAKIAGAFLVAIGVAAEFIGDFVAKPYEDIIEAARKEELAELHKQTEDAKLETARLSADAESARAAIAAANARALEAQAELAKFKAPRTISAAQRGRIAEKMKQFTGQEYFGMVASDVGDAWDLWREISLALELAGWQSIPPPGLAVTQYGPPAGIPIAPLEGVMVWHVAARWNDLHPRAEALAKALTAEGVLTGSGPATGDVEKRPDAVMIVIGPKPQK
jgi:hypothetical protein